MTWATISNIVTTGYENATDSPADARENLRKAVVELQNVVNGLNTAGGAAKLDDSTTKVIANSGVQSSGDLILTPASGGSVNIQDVLNLNPKTVTELNALTAATGDIAYCTAGNGSDDCLAVYTGSEWKIVALGSAIN